MVPDFPKHRDDAMTKLTHTAILFGRGVSRGAVTLGLALVATTSAHAAAFVSGDIFAAINNGRVAHYNSSGTLIETLNTTLGGFTTGMAFSAAGNLYVTNFSAGNITRFNGATGAIIAPNPFVTPGSSPESIVFDAAGNFYVGRAGGAFQKYSAAGALLTTYSTPVNSDWLDLAANQATMFYNDEGGQIRRWNTTTNTALADFANNGANGGTASYALRILGNGDVLSAGGSRVLHYSAAGAFLGFYDVTGVDGFFALNVDPTGNSFFSGSFDNGTLYRFTIGAFGNNTQTQTLNTGVGSSNLFGVAIFGEQTVANPVPEASTWMMMIAGFGIAGTSLRYRRRKTTVSFG